MQAQEALAQEALDKPTLGQLLSRARIAAELTQKEVERRTGIDRNQLSAYENDREVPRVATLERIAEAIGLELPWAKGRYPWLDLEFPAA